MSEAQARWRYGARLGGLWLWPRGCWEYDLERAKAAALRTWPQAKMLGVEQLLPTGDGAAGEVVAGTRWICERSWDAGAAIEWRREQPPRAAAPASSGSAIDPDRMWWNRDD